MSEDKKIVGLTYRMSLTKVEDGNKLPQINDFAYLMFIRQPGFKAASYAIAQANIPETTLRVIESENSTTSRTEFQLQISRIKTDDNEKDEKVDLFYSSFVYIILPKDHSKRPAPMSRVAGTLPNVPVTMILIHPVLYDMQKHNSFNFVYNIDERTILNIIKGDYLDDIKKKRAATSPSKTIKFKLFADMDTVNKSTYGQITIPSTISELQTPEYLIDSYKPFSTPSFWFFDTFNYGNYDKSSDPVNGEIPIWAILLNFFNAVDKFQKIDISKDNDIQYWTQLISSIPYTDTLGTLCKEDSVANFINTTDMTQKRELLGKIPSTLKTDNTLEKQEERVSSLEIYYPDNIETAKQRIFDCVNLMQNQIFGVEIYETSNTTPEWLKFGCLYNIERDANTQVNLNKYIHTPLSIINIFLRREQIGGRMEHLMKYSMLRLGAKGDSSNTSTNITPSSAEATKAAVSSPEGSATPPTPPPAAVAPPEIKEAIKQQAQPAKLTYSKEQAESALTQGKNSLDNYFEYVDDYNHASNDMQKQKADQMGKDAREEVRKCDEIIQTYNRETGSKIKDSSNFYK